MTKVMDYLRNNCRFNKIFKFWEKKQEEKKSESVSYGNYVSEFCCFEGFLNLERFILFYEWSDLTNKPLRFGKVKDFYEFIKKSNIKIPDYDARQDIGKNQMIYATCRKSEASLLISETFDGLKEKLEKN